MVKINVSHTLTDEGWLPLALLCSSVQVVEISLSLPYVFIHHYLFKIYLSRTQLTSNRSCVCMCVVCGVWCCAGRCDVREFL